MGAYLQNWIDCNNDSGLNKIMVFLSKKHLCCIFFLFSFPTPPPPLLFHFETRTFWTVQNLFLVLSHLLAASLILFLCCFYVINYVAVAPGVLNQDQRSSDERYCTDCEDYPYSFPIQKQRHRKRSRKTKCISYDLWMCPSSSEFSGHALFMSSAVLSAVCRFATLFCRLWDR